MLVRAPVDPGDAADVVEEAGQDELVVGSGAGGEGGGLQRVLELGDRLTVVGALRARGQEREQVSGHRGAVSLDEVPCWEQWAVHPVGVICTTMRRPHCAQIRGGSRSCGEGRSSDTGLGCHDMGDTSAGVDAFFLPLGGERYLGTPRCAGPWAPDAMHGGPPCALLARACAAVERRDDTRVARVTVDFLGSVPVGEVSVTARVLRPGRRVELVEATLSAGGRDVLSARAWRIHVEQGRTLDVSGTPAAPAVGPLPAGPVDLPWAHRYDFESYLDSIEWRSSGQPMTGPVQAWTRMRVPLLAGEEPTGLERAVVVADSGNGLSTTLGLDWHFINTDLTVALQRHPVGEWISVDARTAIDDHGIGLATTTLADQTGVCGVGAQTLLVAPR